MITWNVRVCLNQPGQPLREIDSIGCNVSDIPRAYELIQDHMNGVISTLDPCIEPFIIWPSPPIKAGNFVGGSLYVDTENSKLDYILCECEPVPGVIQPPMDSDDEDY